MDDNHSEEVHFSHTQADEHLSDGYAGDPRFERTARVLGPQAVQILADKRVAVFGAGGVGGALIEALARAGIGTLDIIDNDDVALSNVNRQLLAVESTIGRPKAEAAAGRIHEINPQCVVNVHKVFYLPETAADFDFTKYDYVADAIDTVTGKIQLILQAKEAGVPVISCMGTGNKVHPELLELADIYDTSVCPLARVMRHELKKRGVAALKVVYSKEEPLIRTPDFPGSTSFVPPVAGFIMAGEIVRGLLGIK